jgi:integrase
VSLKDARERREHARKLIELGHDPGAAKKAGKERAAINARNSFEAVARAWLAHQAASWDPGHAERVQRTLEADVFPAVGSRSIAHIKPRDVVREIPPFLAKLAANEGDPITTAALRLLMLTAVRPGELRGARWDEIDTDAAVWRVPAERMKMRAPHGGDAQERERRERLADHKRPARRWCPRSCTT